MPRRKKLLTKSGRPDGRAHNPGRPATPDGEDHQFVRGSTELLEAMRVRAGEQGIPIAEAWRRAARTWLAHGTLTPEDLAELEG